MEKSFYSCGTALKNDADFDNAIWFRLLINIRKDDFIVDYGGFVERQDEVSVVINGIYFLKDNWRFVVC
jgi:hypothetical protein